MSWIFHSTDCGCLYWVIRLQEAATSNPTDHATVTHGEAFGRPTSPEFLGLLGQFRIEADRPRAVIAASPLGLHLLHMKSRNRDAQNR